MPINNGNYRGNRLPRKKPADTKKPFVPSNRADDSSQETDSSIIEGRNPMLEALKAGQTIDKLFVLKPAEGVQDNIAAKIVQGVKAQGGVVVECDRRMLDRMSVTGAHQGVIAYAAAAAYVEISDIIAAAKESGRAPLIVICDSINDPGNLGAIIRSAEIAGAHGIIIPKRRSAGLTPAVFKASAGAVSYLPVARTPNITAAIKELKDAGIWVFGTDASAEKTLFEADFTIPTALVIGSEGTGMSRLVGENCDFTVKIPMQGHINSLNASAAAAVLLFETVRQRGVI